MQKVLSILTLAGAALVFTASAPSGPEYTREELLGKINMSRHDDFKKIPRRYSNRSDAYLRDEVFDAFKRMWKAARKDGVKLEIISATRDYAHQKRIWTGKWQLLSASPVERAQRILRYSSMPGTSRHHWGTDFDLNSLENSYFEVEPGLSEYAWLRKNAADYGFYQPYQAYDSHRDAGYREEKWHWSYFPLALRFQRAYDLVIQPADLRGFPGDSLVVPMKVINEYVYGTAPVPDSYYGQSTSGND